MKSEPRPSGPGDTADFIGIDLEDHERVDSTSHQNENGVSSDIKDNESAGERVQELPDKILEESEETKADMESSEYDTVKEVSKENSEESESVADFERLEKEVAEQEEDSQRSEDPSTFYGDYRHGPE